MYSTPAEDPGTVQEMTADGRFAVVLAIPRKRVSLGDIFATPGALQTINWANLNPADLVKRHALGDWGDLSDEDWKSNDKAALQGERIVSSYQLPTAGKVLVVTECDRSATTLLRPEDY